MSTYIKRVDSDPVLFQRVPGCYGMLEMDRKDLSLEAHKRMRKGHIH